MTTVTLSQATSSQTPKLNLEGGARLKCDGTDPKFGDWRDDLLRDGYAVVKGAVPQERALSYANRMLGLLESLYVFQSWILYSLYTC